MVGLSIYSVQMASKPATLAENNAKLAIVTKMLKTVEKQMKEWNKRLPESPVLLQPAIKALIESLGFIKQSVESTKKQLEADISHIKEKKEKKNE